MVSDSSWLPSINKTKHGRTHRLSNCYATACSHYDLAELYRALWLRGSGSAGHCQPARSQVSPVRDLWLCGRLGDDFRRCAGLARDAQASFKQGHEPQNGSHYGGFSNTLDLLRTADRVTAGDRVEHDRGINQFLQCRRIPLFRPKRKTRFERATLISATPVHCGNRAC